MSGIVDLDTLIESLAPRLSETEYVYISVEKNADWSQLDPLATFRENEGLSLVIDRFVAEQSDLPFENTFRLITLEVHSSLEAVGLTAAVAGALTLKGISANVIAAFYHDHILVPTHQAAAAMDALLTLRDSHRPGNQP